MPHDDSMGTLNEVIKSNNHRRTEALFTFNFDLSIQEVDTAAANCEVFFWRRDLVQGATVSSKF